MFKYICLILVSMVLPSIAVTPQQLINGGQLLYEGIVSRDFLKINNILKDQTQLQSKTELFKQARKLAKEKKDAQTTQYLTEQIIEQQKNVYERHYILAPLLAATVAFVIGCRLGGYVEREGLMRGDG